MPALKTFLLSLAVAMVVDSDDVMASDTLLYRSPYEARILNSEEAEADFLALFLAVNSDSASYLKYSSSLAHFLSSLDPKVEIAKGGKRKAKVIFKEVHDYFFRQYQENVLFERIFDVGTYNCLTASMLYSLVLDRYGIPFEVKEKPTHVYLVAYPGSDNILFETTSPKGFFVLDEKAKREYVAGLVAMKLTTQEYVNSIGAANAFNEFYYSNQNISLRQLAGLQYFNLAVESYESGDKDDAIMNAMKATLLYPCTKNMFLKMSLIREVLANSDYESLTHIAYLAEFANSSQDTQDKKYVLGVFGDMLNTKLIKKSNESFVSRAYGVLNDRIKDKELRNEVTYNYELSMTNWYSMKGDMDSALVYAERVYVQNPNDVRIHDLVARSLALKTEKWKGDTKAIETLHTYEQKFPFLSNNNLFRTIVVYQYAARAYSLFTQNAGIEGNECLQRVEKTIDELGGCPMMMEQLIAFAYAEAGAFHFRQRQYARAKEILRRGLEIVPDHGELKERLKIVEEEEVRISRR